MRVVAGMTIFQALGWQSRQKEGGNNKRTGEG
jgi:hypothetical protein